MTRTLGILQGFCEAILSPMRERIVGSQIVDILVKHLKGALLYFHLKISRRSTHTNLLNISCSAPYQVKIETTSCMRFDCVLLLMASTFSFHFDSFIARIDEIFLFVVAWERARKVDNESLWRGLCFAAFSRGYYSASVHAVVVTSSLFHHFSEKSVCKIVLLAFFSNEKL